MKKTVTWILTADHQHARVYSNDGPGRGIRPVETLSMDGHLPVSHEAGSHRPDIGFASRGGPSHGIEPSSTPHQQAGREFIDGVASAVSEALTHGGFDRLIVVAPPRALGELRELLPKQVRDRVVGELDLDLAKAPTADVLEHVERFLS